jgi:hypothetical protein
MPRGSLRVSQLVQALSVKISRYPGWEGKGEEPSGLNVTRFLLEGGDGGA